MRVENFTKRASQYFGSVGLVVLMLALFPSVGFSQYPCSCVTPTFQSIGTCGFPQATDLTDFDKCGPYVVPKTAAGSMDSLTIDLSGQVCFDAAGNAVTPANPQGGEVITWSSFQVPANTGTFGINVQNAESISYAIYHTPNMACASTDFSFVSCGVNTAAMDTVDIMAAGNLAATGYYHLAVWDAASNSTADDMDLEESPSVTLYNNCGDDLMCNVSISSPVIKDNFDDTYFMCVTVTGFNAAYTIQDAAAMDTLPSYGSGMAPSYPDTICFGLATDPAPMTTELCLLYNDDVDFSGAQVLAVVAPGCNAPENIADCVAFVVAPPAVNFTLDCNAACFDKDDGAGPYTSLDDIPAPRDSLGLDMCGAISVVAGTSITVTANDIVTPITGGLLVTRLYCVTDGGTLPGTADDETECCTQEFMVMADPGDCPLSCNDLIQISLDQNCEARVTPDMMLEGDAGTDCNYFLKLEDENGDEIGNPLTCEYVGQKIKVSVFSGINSCWGEILLEDKIKPTIEECQAIEPIGCNATEPFFDPVRDVGASDNCGLPLELIVISNILEDKGCDDGPVATRTITYVLRDKKGNLSEQCTYTINFMQADLDCENLNDDMGLMRPRNWNNAPGEMPELNCVDSDGDGNLDWDSDGDGIVDVSFTGAPTLDGNSIFPDSEGYCKVQATFSDTKITVGSCDKNFKLLRQWTVLNWCDSDQICQFYQIIKVVDDSPPITTSEIVDCFEVPIDNAFSCSTSFDVPAPTIIFECNDYTWTVSYLPSTLVPTFDADPYDVSVCLQPEDFETEGLFIETGIVRESGDNTPITITGLPIGQTWIRYNVTDECGNTSVGASEIRVTENIPPTPVCDEHTTVTLTSQNQARVWAKTFDDDSYDLCGYDITYDVRRMDEPDSAFKEFIDFDCDDIGAGNMIVLRVTDRGGFSNICMVEAAVWGRSNLAWSTLPDDQLNLACGADTSVTALGMPTATDDCGDPIITFSDGGSLNNCGYGTLTRTFTAVSADGKKEVTHTQNIEIVSPITNIVWPNEFVEHNGCGSDDDLSPDIAKFGRPSYDDSDCNMIAVTHKDQNFNFTEGACLKVVRTWTVIDWCNFNANSNNRETFVQVIKVYNDVAPAANGCAEIVDQVLIGDCEVGVTINSLYTDDCNSLDELIVTYAVDGGARSLGTSFEGTLGYGTHTMLWTAEDRCSNISTCTFEFTLEEDKQPTPYCLGGITTVVMDNGQVDIWAVDFDRNSFDNCPDNQLDFTMRPRGSSETPTASYTFNCIDLGINEVEIHVTDPFGNTDFCITTIKVQSNGDACDNVGNGGALISGLITTEYNEAVVDAMVMLEQMGPNTPSMIQTNSNGSYSFNNVPTNADYEITADKTDDYINGVSTLDIVYIQRHILGLGLLDSPYKVIAADANNTQSLSGGDLVVLRKLILGVIDELPNSESWKFVDAEQAFNNQYNPWPYMGKLDVYGIQSDMPNNNFIALKVGDVTGDAQPNEALSAEVRNNNKLDLYAVNQVFTQGELVTIPIKVTENTDLLGLQTTISFNQELLSFEGFDSDKLDLSKNNFGLHLNDRGVVTMSWNVNEELGFSENEKVLELTFRAKKTGQLSSNVSLTSLLTRSEAYTTDYEVLDVALALVESDGSIAEGLQLFQNKPNPFDDTSIIGFNIPKEGKVSLSVFDITGKKVVTLSDNYTKGYHEIALNRSYLNGSGLYYYQIELNGERAMKKMLLIE